MQKMRTISDIRNRITEIINKEIKKTAKEIEDFERKIKDNEYCYGMGGWYTQFTKAKERREKHIGELEALKRAQGNSVVLKTITFYPYSCPSCNLKVLLSSGYGEKVYCPICERPIYKSARYEEMKIKDGSRVAITNNGRITQLSNEGRFLD